MSRLDEEGRRSVPIDDILRQHGLAPGPQAPLSSKRFPDGAHFRIEIPSVEGAEVLRAVIEAAHSLGVTVNRVSQGSGAMLLTAGEISEMAKMGADEGIEVSLFVGPREEWGIGTQSRSAEGPGLAGRIRGVRQLRYALDDVLRAVELGIRGFLVADTGLLELLVAAQQQGDIPRSVVWKVSALMSPTNPVTLRQLVALGGSTVNLPSDLDLVELAEMRAATDVPLDLYVESPDSLGGIVRGNEIADLVGVGAPLHTKFGLRNAPSIYPSGAHLLETARRIAVEKVHRAAVALEWLARSGRAYSQSAPGAAGAGVPEP